MSRAAVDQTRQAPGLSSLPGDDVRRRMWRYAERPEVESLVGAVRAVARGPVAQLVAAGGRQSADWTPAKTQMLVALAASGATRVLLPPAAGGMPSGARNLALALSVMELAWVDGGAAACDLALNLALDPFVSAAAGEPSLPLAKGAAAAGAISFRETFLHTDEEAGPPCGQVKIVQWNAGQEPVLEVRVPARPTANIDVADFVVVSVASDDARFRGTCLLRLEPGDEGTFDRGPVVPKLAYQLCSVREAAFQLRVPASRIIGGYTIRDGVLVPRLSHRQVLSPVLARSHVASATMTAARLLSAIEPLIREQRTGLAARLPADPEAWYSLVDVWAAGEGAAALGLAAARQLDRCETLCPDTEPVEPAQMVAARELALESLRLTARPAAERDERRLAELQSNRQVKLVLEQSLAEVLAPAARLFAYRRGLIALRDALMMMADSALLESCPGFLAQKWLDAQFEAAGGPSDRALRRQVARAMSQPLFKAQAEQWVLEMRRIASQQPGTGACAIASALDLWLWTLEHLGQSAQAADETVSFEHAVLPLADALCWLLAARYQILDAVELADAGGQLADSSDPLAGQLQFFVDLCHAQSARAAGEVGRISAETVFGYRSHPTWDPSCKACVPADEIDVLEILMPGISYGTRMVGDVLESDGSHAQKAGPCVRLAGLQGYFTRREKLDGCITGAQIARDRAAQSIAGVTIPESLDYPR